LVVDDDFGTREALTDLLQDRGYSVISAADGREALNYCGTLLRLELLSWT
jgi:CheY-like chemotaxis protein